MPSLVEEGSPHCTTVPSISDLVCVSIEVVLGNKQSMLCVTVWLHSYFFYMWLEEDPKTDGAWERMNLVMMEITSFPDVTV